MSTNELMVLFNDGKQIAVEVGSDVDEFWSRFQDPEFIDKLISMDDDKDKIAIYFARRCVFYGREVRAFWVRRVGE